MPTPAANTKTTPTPQAPARDPIAVARVRLVAPTGPADLRDRRRLDALEAVIDRGIASFIEVGEALTEVRESRLYRLTHSTFEDYLKDRWNLSRSRGNQLMDAAAVSTMVDIQNERQARELVPVLRAGGPEAVREVFAKVIVQTDANPTAKAIQVIVQGGDDADDGQVQRANAQHVLDELIDWITRLSALYPADDLPNLVGSRRRATNAKRLRKAGSVLARWAWALEGSALDEGGAS